MIFGVHVRTKLQQTVKNKNERLEYIAVVAFLHSSATTALLLLRCRCSMLLLLPADLPSAEISG